MWIQLADTETSVLKVPGGMIVNTRSADGNGKVLTESNVTVYCDDEAALDKWIEENKAEEETEDE